MKVKTLKNLKKQSYLLSLSLSSLFFALINKARQSMKHGTKRWEKKWIRKYEIF